MPGFAYLDASALVKLAAHEAETPALERAVLDRDALFTSEVGAIELHRALPNGAGLDTGSMSDRCGA